MFGDNLSCVGCFLFCVFVVGVCLGDVLCFDGGVVAVTISVYRRFG